MMNEKKLKKKNYNMELIRTVSFVMVIMIHITNYYCRAYGDISGGGNTCFL